MQTLTVTANEAGQRLDKLLAKYLNQAGKGFIYKMIRKKNITLNGKRCDGSERLAQGDEVRLFLSDETIEKFSATVAGSWKAGYGNDAKKGMEVCRGKGFAGRPDIVYEDVHILIVNKPAGMLSQKAREGDISLNEHILNYLVESGHIPVSQLRTFKPSICNRLDRNTSGLVAAGISLAGLQIMNQVFKDRSIHKYYRCLVRGDIREKQLIAGFLKKDEASNTVRIYQLEVEDSVPIMTEYVPLGGNGAITLLQVTLITGRSHQIRAHLASIGHPILGDYKYGDSKVNDTVKMRYGVKYQMLHSWKLAMPEELPEPLGYLGGRVFQAELPARFRDVLKGEAITFDGSGLKGE